MDFLGYFRNHFFGYLSVLKTAVNNNRLLIVFSDLDLK